VGGWVKGPFGINNYKLVILVLHREHNVWPYSAFYNIFCKRVVRFW